MFPSAESNRARGESHAESDQRIKSCFPPLSSDTLISRTRDTLLLGVGQWYKVSCRSQSLRVLKHCNRIPRRNSRNIKDLYGYSPDVETRMKSSRIILRGEVRQSTMKQSEPYHKKYAKLQTINGAYIFISL